MLHYSNTNTTVDKILLTERTSITNFKGNFIQDNGELEFSNLEGTVTKVELCQFQFFYSGNQMYVGLDKSNSSKLLHLQGNNSDYDYPSSDATDYVSATFEGSVAVSTSDPLCSL